MAVEKILFGDGIGEAVDKVNAFVQQTVDNQDSIEDLEKAVEDLENAIKDGVGTIDGVKINSKTVEPDGDKIVNIEISAANETVTVTTDDNGKVLLSANIPDVKLPENIASSLSLTIDTTTYVLTAILKDINGKTLSTQTIDLPLETMVVNASYNDTTKEIELTLQNGTKTSFSVADLVAGLVSTDTNFTNAEILVADGDGKKAKSSGKKVVTEDIFNNIVNTFVVPASQKNKVPDAYSVEYAIRETLPEWFLLLAFKKGKTLYSSGHADYNKLILVANSAGTNLTTADTSTAIAIAKSLDRGYDIVKVTKGFYTPLITNIEKTYTEDANGLKTYTIKLLVDEAKQDELTKMDDNGGILWLERKLPYFAQDHYIEAE